MNVAKALRAAADAADRLNKASIPVRKVTAWIDQNLPNYCMEFDCEDGMGGRLTVDNFVEQDEGRIRNEAMAFAEGIISALEKARKNRGSDPRWDRILEAREARGAEP